MWLLIIGGTVTLIGGILLKAADLLIEGRGSWARRAIAADVQLLTALPDAIRGGEGGKALTSRIEHALLQFAGDEETGDADLDELFAELDFRKEVTRLEVAALGCFAVVLLVAAVVLVFTWPEASRGGDTVNPWFLIGILPGMPVLAFAIASGMQVVAVRVVRRRWRRRGWEIPAKYATGYGLASPFRRAPRLPPRRRRSTKSQNP